MKMRQAFIEIRNQFLTICSPPTYMSVVQAFWHNQNARKKRVDEKACQATSNGPLVREKWQNIRNFVNSYNIIEFTVNKMFRNCKMTR